MFLLLAVSILPFTSGCHDENGEAESEHELIAAPAAAANEFYLRPDAQSAIGLATATAEWRDVRDSITASGWLAARPGSELTAKAPTTGFIVPSRDPDYLLGRPVTKDERLAVLKVFLSPQEQAQLVAAKEEADIQIRQSQATLRLANEQLKRVEEAGATAVPGTRLLELREIVARSRAEEQEAREKLPYLPVEESESSGSSYGEKPRLKGVPMSSPLRRSAGRHPFCAAAIGGTRRSALDDRGLVAPVDSRAGFCRRPRARRSR